MSAFSWGAPIFFIPFPFFSVVWGLLNPPEVFLCVFPPLAHFSSRWGAVVGFFSPGWGAQPILPLWCVVGFFPPWGNPPLFCLLSLSHRFPHGSLAVFFVDPPKGFPGGGLFCWALCFFKNLGRGGPPSIRESCGVGVFSHNKRGWVPPPKNVAAI